MDLEKVFKADPLSVERVIGYPGRGFYIPSYQRPYAWSPGQAVSLITSVTEGAQTLLSMEDAITFIGTFIFIHDTDYATVEPKVRGELPPQVYLVIDGQQRLTTLSLIAISLHDSLFSVSQRVKGTEDVVLWSKQQSQELLRRLERILALEGATVPAAAPVAGLQTSPAQAIAPDFRGLNVDGARRHAERRGLTVLFEGRGSFVVDQDPSPRATQANTVVLCRLGAPADAFAVALPAMPLRQAALLRKLGAQRQLMAWAH